MQDNGNVVRPVLGVTMLQQFVSQLLVIITEKPSNFKHGSFKPSNSAGFEEIDQIWEEIWYSWWLPKEKSMTNDSYK